MKKLLVLFLALIMLLTCGIAGAAPEPRKIGQPADADEFIAAFLGDHPEEMEGLWAFTAQMESALAGMGGIPGLAKQLATLGEPKGVHPAREGKVQGLTAFFVPCDFSVMPVDLILIVQDGAIAGISTGAYSGAQEKEAVEEEPDAAPYDTLSLPLPVPSLGDLPGLLTLPKGEGPFPAVVLIHGSGSCDMDETLGSQKPFRDLAEGLASRGIAVYRFDKRTYVFASELAADTQFTLMEESVEDAVAAVRLLASQDRIDAGRIFVLGHSMGGNAIPAIARELDQAPVQVCGFIMMAASPRPLEVLMRDQYNFLYSLLPEITPEAQAEKDRLFTDLDRLRHLDTLADEDVVAGAYAPYWRWLAAYDVLQTAKEIPRPVLLLQGEEDYQVTMEDFGLWKDALASRENWTLISYPGLTHTFAPGSKSEGSEVYLRPETVDSRVLQDLAAFISGV